MNKIIRVVFFSLFAFLFAGEALAKGGGFYTPVIRFQSPKPPVPQLKPSKTDNTIRNEIIGGVVGGTAEAVVGHGLEQIGNRGQETTPQPAPIPAYKMRAMKRMEELYYQANTGRHSQHELDKLNALYLEQIRVIRGQ